MTTVLGLRARASGTKRWAKEDDTSMHEWRRTKGHAADLSVDVRQNRHVKCDEQRPTCSTCRSSGLECAGYEKNIFFDFETIDDVSLSRFRRPLLTEDERLRMTLRIISDVPPDRTLAVLARIDIECETAHSPSELDVQQGPFGVFGTKQQQRCPSSPNALSLQQAADEEQDCDIEVLDLQPSASNGSPAWFQELNDSAFVTTDLLLHQGNLEFLNLSTDLPSMQNIFSDNALFGTSDFSPVPMALQELELFRPSPVNQVLWRSPNPQSLAGPLLDFGPVTQATIFLLKHYSTSIISCLSPFRHGKTPWHSLFLAHAKNTFAALAIGESLGSSALCSYYGILAISALSIGSASASQSWLEHGKTSRQQARENATLMLKTAYDIPKVAKYKSILIAFITMIQLSTLSGDEQATEYYLLEAEKFIRLRGISRRKSRKVRLLHHCYVYMRVLHESTFVQGDLNHRRSLRKQIEDAGLTLPVYTSDSPPFRLMQWHNLDKEMLEVRNQEEGENDLFLYKPGLFLATLYPEIFGISEQWIFLLSQVIRLANSKEASQGEDSIHALPLGDFVRRAKALEDQINRLHTSHTTVNDASPILDQSPLRGFLNAMRDALAIYFYRRIYDVDASMLQPYVTRVHSWLLQFEGTDSDSTQGCLILLWPAFVAASEADNPDIQVSFSDWFQRCDKRTGLSCFPETLKHLETLWRAKRLSDGERVTWLDISRNGFQAMST